MSGRILVVDDEAGLRQMLEVSLRRAGYEVSVAPNVRSGLATIDKEPSFDVIVTDLIMPDGSGMEILRGARAQDDTTQVVMITAFAKTEQAVEAMREGAYDYIQKPFRNDVLRATVEKALEKRAIVGENRALRSEVRGVFRRGDLVGRSPAMRKVLDLVSRIADAPSSVLLTGESGTGKEVVARVIHSEGPRRDAPFIAVNCGALPENLMESELFGYEKGAFTGATAPSPGLFRSANGGTIFLDEVGELPMPLQVKLLRVLQERSVRPVGGSKEHPVDVRVLAATNREIESDVEEGAFRRDLFYRLNVIRIHLPPLRERPDDLRVLADHFLRKHGSLQNKQLHWSDDALRQVAGRSYPGNVRELENLVERAVTLARSEEVMVEDLGLVGPPPAGSGAAPLVEVPEEGLDLETYMGDIERRLLVSALERSGGVRKAAARLLKVTFRSFRYRLAKYGIDDDE